MPNRSALVLLVAALVIGIVVFRQHDEGRTAALRADWARTPGSLNPAVMQATIGRTICIAGWTRTIRPPSSYTSALKLQQMREYQFTGSPADYEEDHLVSLELGGSPTDPRNLWPEARPRANDVDRIENDLHARVCAGELTLAEAQKKISEIKHADG